MPTDAPWIGDLTAEERVQALIDYSWDGSRESTRLKYLDAIRDAERRGIKLALERAAPSLWEALKQRCAADPSTAKRLVMVSEDDIAAAIRQLGEKP